MDWINFSISRLGCFLALVFLVVLLQYLHNRLRSIYSNYYAIVVCLSSYLNDSVDYYHI